MPSLLDSEFMRAGDESVFFFNAIPVGSAIGIMPDTY